MCDYNISNYNNICIMYTIIIYSILKEYKYLLFRMHHIPNSVGPVDRAARGSLAVLVDHLALKDKTVLSSD